MLLRKRWVSNVLLRGPSAEGCCNDTSIKQCWPILAFTVCQAVAQMIVVRASILLFPLICVSLMIEPKKPNLKISFLIQTDIIFENLLIEVSRILIICLRTKCIIKQVFPVLFDPNLCHWVPSLNWQPSPVRKLR